MPGRNRFIVRIWRGVPPLVPQSVKACDRRNRVVRDEFGRIRSISGTPILGGYLQVIFSWARCRRETLQVYAPQGIRSRHRRWQCQPQTAKLPDAIAFELARLKVDAGGSSPLVQPGFSVERIWSYHAAMNPIDLSKSLQDLDGRDWGEPDYTSHLVTMCYRLRKKRLRDFTTEDLRIMIGQKMSLEYLMPLAVERLQADPLAEGDYYPGDLLKAVVTVARNYWEANPEAKKAIDNIVARAQPLPAHLRSLGWPPAE